MIVDGYLHVRLEQDRKESIIARYHCSYFDLEIIVEKGDKRWYYNVISLNSNAIRFDYQTLR